MPTAEDDDARTSRALLDLAKTTPDDLYALLGLTNPTLGPSTPSVTPAILKKAWRTTALLHHPDKNRGHEALAADKLDAARKAYDVLCDDKAREVFDNRQRAGREKREREEKLEGRRRVMKEELERAERGGGGDGVNGGVGGSGVWGVKRKMGDGVEGEVQRLAAEGARRREEMLRRVREESEDRAAAAAAVKRRKAEKTGHVAEATQNGDAETDIKATSKTFAFPINGTNGATGTSNGDGIGKANSTPSFSSSTSAATGGNKLQATLARLKEAQRKQAEEKIKQEDAAAEAVGT